MSEEDRAAEAPAALTLADVARLVEGRLEGPADHPVRRIAPLDEAGPEDMGFLAIGRYARFIPASAAGSILVVAGLEDLLPEATARVVVEAPYRALRTLLAVLHPGAPRPPTIHPTAVIGRRVRLGEGVRIEPYAVIEGDVSVGEGTRVGAHCVLGAGAKVGAHCTLHPHVVVYPDSLIGDGVVLHSGVRVGSDGFGYTSIDGRNEKMPQVGRAVVGDGVEIGANTTIDRGSLGDTVLGEGVKIDNLVQVGHNVRVGADSMLAALVGIAGSTRIGRGVWLGGAASAVNHLEIGDGARVTFGSTVTRDVPAGETVSGYPARPHREELRKEAYVARLPKLFEQVRKAGID